MKTKMPDDYACSTQPDAWFTTHLYDMAKAACNGCQIFAQCREIGWSQEYGVFGGLDENDRRRIDQRRFEDRIHERRVRVRAEDEDNRRRPARTCIISGCGRRVDANGMCGMHWQRQYTHGDPNHEPFSGALKNSVKCRFPGCERPYAARDWCKSHYDRHKATGDILGSKSNIMRSDERHAEIHRLLHAAMEEWHKGSSTTETCLELVEGAIEEASGVLTRGELDAIRGMDIKLVAKVDKEPWAGGPKALEMEMRYNAIVQLALLGTQRRDIALQLGVSLRTVDRATRMMTTGIRARARETPQYRVVR